MTSPYREKAPPTHEELNALRKQVADLKQTAKRVDERRKRRASRLDWMSKHWGDFVVAAVIVAIVLAIAWAWATIDSPGTRERKHLDAFHAAQLACVPGWVEKLDGSDRYQWRYGDSRVICTDGTRRWVAELEEKE